MTSTETPERDGPTPEETDAAPPADAEAAALPAAPEKTPFWQRPMVDRYLTPLLLPPLVIGGVVFFALNISRIFLSGHGHVSVLVGSMITIGIIVGAAVLAAAPKMRTGSLVLVTVMFLWGIAMFGWLSLGHSEVEGEAGGPLPAEGPSTETLEFISSNDLKFDPSAADAETGIADITLNNEGGQHTLTFEDEAVQFDHLTVAASGDTDASRAFFGEAGEYVFFCEIPGHREAGMVGTITVTGDPTTVEAAEAAAGGGAEGGEAPAP